MANGPRDTAREEQTVEGEKGVARGPRETTRAEQAVDAILENQFRMQH